MAQGVRCVSSRARPALRRLLLLFLVILNFGFLPCFLAFAALEHLVDASICNLWFATPSTLSGKS